MSKKTTAQEASTYPEGAQTMFMVSARNQLELISIADNKANVITAICVILIFLIIALFSSGLTIEGIVVLERLDFVVPLSILLVFCCISAICAILALKPKIIKSKKDSRSALFFHNYYRKSLEEYKTEMKEVISSNGNIYDHMFTDMYYNGLVLERKYALLGFSYTIFLLAILLSVSSYVITSVT